VAVDDGGGDPVEIGRRLEHGEGTGVAPDMGRRAVAYPSSGLMVVRQVWVRAVLDDGERRMRRRSAHRCGR
jgi:hypothetical protein